MPLPRLIERHPYWFVALLEIVVIAVYLLAGTIAFLADFSNYALTGLANSTLSLLVIGALSALGWWRAVGFRWAAHPRDLLLFLPLALPILINLVVGVDVPGLALFTQLLALALLIGFAEEAIFRGLMLNALKPHGLWQAAIMTSLLFGLSHVLNLLSGKGGLEILIQIAYALAVGFAFAALALKKQLLWPLVIVHALIDFTGFIGKNTLPAFWDTIAGIVITFLFMSYGLFLMRQPSAEPPLCAVESQ